MKTVLIVDDDEPTQQLLAALMRRNGLASVVAGNGQKALDILGTTDFALIILDLMMPHVDGQAVIEYVAREKPNIPVILCTAAGPLQTDKIELGTVRAIVRKPFDIDRITELVSSLTS